MVELVRDGLATAVPGKVTAAARKMEVARLRITEADSGRSSSEEAMSPPRSMLADPAHWRQRAEEARTIAQQVNNPSAKTTWLASPSSMKRWPRTHASRKTVDALDTGARNQFSSWPLVRSARHVGMPRLFGPGWLTIDPSRAFVLQGRSRRARITAAA